MTNHERQDIAFNAEGTTLEDGSINLNNQNRSHPLLSWHTGIIV